MASSRGSMGPCRKPIATPSPVGKISFDLAGTDLKAGHFPILLYKKDSLLIWSFVDIVGSDRPTMSIKKKCALIKGDELLVLIGPDAELAPGGKIKMLPSGETSIYIFGIFLALSKAVNILCVRFATRFLGADEKVKKFETKLLQGGKLTTHIILDWDV